MYQEKRPHSDVLARYVDCFWLSTVSSSDEGGVLILPDGAMDIIFHSSPQGFKPLLCGVMSTASTVYLSAGDTYFGIRFHPAMASIGLKIDGAVFTDCIIDAPLLGDAGRLEDLLHTKEGDLAAFVFWAETALLKIINVDEGQRRKALALHDVALSGNHFSGAQAIGLSRKRFYRDFVSLYGISPRQYANTHRLIRFQKLVLTDGPVNLSQIALACGFYDQPDMTRQIKKITGKTPVQLMSHLYNTVRG